MQLDPNEVGATLTGITMTVWLWVVAKLVALEWKRNRRASK
jgi:hypothetical protein